MHALQHAATAALRAELEEHKAFVFTDATYKPMVTLLRRAGDELVEQLGIPNSHVLAYIEAAFGADAYERVLDGGSAEGLVAGYRASAVGSPVGTAILTIRLA